MNQEKTNLDERKFEGSMYLFSQAELLSVEDHGHLGINASPRPYDFLKSSRVVPIAATEAITVQRHYPIIFSDLKEPSLLAVVGVLDDVNLFVDENGLWDTSAYVPAYIRCHPFALASRPDDQFAVVIDRASDGMSENAEQPFFTGNQLNPEIQPRVDLCAQFRAHREATKLFCEKMVELDLLSGQQLTFKSEESGEEQSTGPYVAVNFDKVKELDAEVLRQLSLDEMLPAIYAHRFSLDNWLQLLERRKQRQSGD